MIIVGLNPLMMIFPVWPEYRSAFLPSQTESHLEARLWADAFALSEEELGIPPGRSAAPS